MFEQMEKEDKVYGNLLNGEWVASASGETIGIYSPIDGSLLGSVQAMTREESGPSRCFHQGLHSCLVRSAGIRTGGNLLSSRRFIGTVRPENRGSSRDGSGQGEKVRPFRGHPLSRPFALHCGHRQKPRGQAISGENFPGGSRSKISYVERVPLGTILAISPFNYRSTYLSPKSRPH